MLVAAKKYGTDEVMQFLLKSGADPDARNHAGMSAKALAEKPVSEVDDPFADD